MVKYFKDTIPIGTRPPVHGIVIRRLGSKRETKQAESANGAISDWIKTEAWTNIHGRWYLGGSQNHKHECWQAATANDRECRSTTGQSKIRAAVG